MNTQMNTQLQDTFIAEVSSTLLADSPNLELLQQKIKAALNCSSAHAQDLIFKTIAQVNANLFPPLTQIELVLTEGCNLGCTYCFEKEMLGYRKMPFEVAKRAIDLLFCYSLNETELHIAHFGGEPTLNFQAVKAVTEYAERRSLNSGKKVYFNMTSNGVLINEEIAEYCGRHRIMVMLSLDGLKASHDKHRKDKRGEGTFDKVIQGMKILKQFQPWTGIKMTVMPENVANLFEDVTSLYEMGVNQFTIGYATGIKWSSDEMQAYSEQVGKLYQWYTQSDRNDLLIKEFDELNVDANYFGCQAGRSSISISVNGEISPCSKILALNNKSLLSKLGDVWYGLSFIKNRIELTGCSKLKSACKEREIDQEYQGGCFATNYDENQNLFIPNMQDYQLSLLQRSACAGCNSCQ
jgi:uncharacterized protein